MTKKTFFKGLATILLLPGGFILAAVLAILFAVLLAVSIYVVIFVALFDWIISRVRALTLSFRKAAKDNDENNGLRRPAPLRGTGVGLPEDVRVHDGFKTVEEVNSARRKWLQ